MKILSGYGKLYFANWEYKPVPGDRKSGIPAAVDRPAPVITTIFFAKRERKPLKKTAGITQKTRYFFKKSFSLKSPWWVLKNFAKVPNKFIWSTSSLVRLQVYASSFHKKDSVMDVLPGISWSILKVITIFTCLHSEMCFSIAGKDFSRFWLINKFASNDEFQEICF